MPKSPDPMNTDRGTTSAQAALSPVVQRPRQDEGRIQTGSTRLDAGRMMDRAKKALRGSATERAVRACQRAAKTVVKVDNPTGKEVNPFLLVQSVGTAARYDLLNSMGLVEVEAGKSDGAGAAGGLDRVQRSLKPYEAARDAIDEALVACLADVEREPLKLFGKVAVGLPPMAAFKVEVVKAATRQSSAMSRLVNIGDCRSEKHLMLAAQIYARQKDVFVVLPKLDATGGPVGPQRLLNGFIHQSKDKGESFVGLMVSKDQEPHVVVSARIARVKSQERPGVTEEASVPAKDGTFPLSTWLAAHGVPDPPKLVSFGKNAQVKIPADVLDQFEAHGIKPVFGQINQGDLLPSAFAGSERAMGAKLTEQAAMESVTNFVDEYVAELERVAGDQPVGDDALSVACAPFVEKLKKSVSPGTHGFERFTRMAGGDKKLAKALVVGFIGTEREGWLQARGYAAGKVIQAYQEYETQYSQVGRMKGSPFMTEVEPAITNLLEENGLISLLSEPCSSGVAETHKVGQHVDSMFVHAATRYAKAAIPENLFRGERTSAKRVSDLDGVQRLMACGVLAMEEAMATMEQAYAGSLTGTGLTPAERADKVASFHGILEPVLGPEAQARAVANVNKAIGKKLGDANRMLRVAIGNALGSAVAQITMAKPSEFGLQAIQGGLVASRAAVVFGGATDLEQPSAMVVGYDEKIKGLTDVDGIGRFSHPVLRAVQSPGETLGEAMTAAWRKAMEPTTGGSVEAVKEILASILKTVELCEAEAVGNSDGGEPVPFKDRADAFALKGRILAVQDKLTAAQVKSAEAVDEILPKLVEEIREAIRSRICDLGDLAALSEGAFSGGAAMRDRQNYGAELTRARETFQIVGFVNEALETAHKSYGDLARFLRNLGRMKGDHALAVGRKHIYLNMPKVKSQLGQVSMSVLVPVKGKDEGVTYKYFAFGKGIDGDLELVRQRFLAEGEVARTLIDDNSVNVRVVVRRGKATRGEMVGDVDSLLHAALETIGATRIGPGRYLASVQIKSSGFILDRLGINLAGTFMPMTQNFGGARLGGMKDPWTWDPHSKEEKARILRTDKAILAAPHAERQALAMALTAELEGPHFGVNEGGRGMSESDMGRTAYYPASKKGIEAFTANLDAKAAAANLAGWQRDLYDKKVKPALVEAVRKLVTDVEEAATKDQPYSVLALAPGGSDDMRGAPWCMAVVPVEEVPEGPTRDEVIGKNISATNRALNEIIGRFQNTFRAQCEPVEINLQNAAVEV